MVETQSTDTVSQTQEVGSDNSAPGMAPATQEKIVSLPQSHFDGIVKNAKLEAKRQVEREYQERAQNEARARETQANWQPSQSNMNQGLPPDMERLVEQKMEQKIAAMQQQQHAWQFTNDFLKKIDMGKSKFPDFDELAQDFDMSQYPYTVQLANLAENTVDVVHYLHSRPLDWGNINKLAQENPKAAMRVMQKVSEDLKANQQAKDTIKSANEPLSQIKQSRVVDNGSHSMAELKQASWLKF